MGSVYNYWSQWKEQQILSVFPEMSLYSHLAPNTEKNPLFARQPSLEAVRVVWGEDRRKEIAPSSFPKEVKLCPQCLHKLDTHTRPGITHVVVLCLCQTPTPWADEAWGHHPTSAIHSLTFTRSPTGAWPSHSLSPTAWGWCHGAALEAGSEQQPTFPGRPWWQPSEQRLREPSMGHNNK